MDFINSLKVLIAGIIISVTTAVAPMPTQNTPAKVISAPAPPSVEDQNINVRGTYSYLGQSIKYLFVIPREGGGFSGSTEGACTATVGGNYDGGEGGKISGRASGKCSFLIFNYSGSMNFKGNLYPAGKKIIIEPDTDRIKPVTINFN